MSTEDQRNLEANYSYLRMLDNGTHANVSTLKIKTQQNLKRMEDYFSDIKKTKNKGYVGVFV